MSIERVARAIKKADDDWHQQKGDALEGLREEPGNLYEGLARAAIEAMREPTGNVTNAGWDAMVRANEDRVDGRELVIWQAMIDEVLK